MKQTHLLFRATGHSRHSSGSRSTWTCPHVSDDVDDPRRPHPPPASCSSRPRLSRHESRECSEPRFPFTGVPHRVPHTAHAARATPGTPTGRHDDILAISIRPAYIRLHKHAARAEAGRWLAPAQCALVTYGFTSAGATGVLHSQAIGCRCLESESTCCSGPEVKKLRMEGDEVSGGDDTVLARKHLRSVSCVCRVEEGEIA